MSQPQVMANNSSGDMTNTSRNFSLLLTKWVIPMTVFSILCVIGLVVNGFLLLVTWKDPRKCLRTHPTFLITNLISADFVAALLNISRLTYRYIVQEFGSDETNDFMKFTVVLGYTALLVSYMTVFLISMEHLGAIASPLKFKVMITNQVIAWSIGLTWFTCLTLTILLYTIPQNHQVFHAITAIHGLLLRTLPTVYTFAYLSLKRQLKRRSDMTNGTTANTAQKQKRILQQKNFLFTSAGIVLLSIISCAPFTIHNYQQFSKDIQYNIYRTSDELGMIFWVILNINLCTDPLIYCLRIPQFRKSCVALWCGRT